ncbi:putative membrane-bound dehydrogenase domain-containing protein [Fodinibius roseus]|uniref:Putative membrane-bound dehydrogenase domain-containing protein n=1 Tax=Fodinibius roseus TaxID=1194090 RepID=A0A1M5AWH4_9BACT|nr:PVC-type heme-binding CxxCH protein [Fodinibius roseus]SHF34560.1 putative membrane-bound dehydrogenase domain-containing protein [Fodinibius roseus]
MKTKFIFVILLLMGVSCSKTDSIQESLRPPLDEDRALASLEVMEGFNVELYASEPLIEDPVAMEVDERGRIYVVEMRSYPLDASGLGRIKLLEDTSGNGFPDSYTIFADSLKFPDGIMRWKDGILVTDAPHIYYMEDTTGNGKADRKEIMLTGFALSNPQHNVNTPIYGLDNWIHLANRGTVSTEDYQGILGDKGSRVGFYGAEDIPKLPQNAGGKNVRFKPDSYQIEMKASSSQYGHTFNAWGDHFLVSNARHQYLEVMERKYTGRNPHLPLGDVNHDTPDHGNAAEVYPTTQNPEHQLLTDRGVITSASGLTWYLGGAFPKEFDRVTFVAESVHNLVHADVVEQEGTVFKARRLLERKEFLTSTDAWFRPVQFYIGPDGALYVIDYYRRIIDHPEWLDNETAQNEEMLLEASNRGRIYRITANEMDDPKWTSNLDLNDMPTGKLVACLENANIWWRRNAQRLLVDRNDPAAVEPLKKLVSNSTVATARLHALWTLEGLGRLDDNLVITALQDVEAGVRKNAVKLAEKRLQEAPSVLESLLAMKDDPDSQVRYQLLLSLGELSSGRIDEVRKKIVFGDLEDSWMQIAFLSAKHIKASPLLDRFLQQFGDMETPGRHQFLQRVATIIGSQGNKREISRHIKESLSGITKENEWWKAAILSGLTESLQHAEIDSKEFEIESDMATDVFFETGSERAREVVMQLTAVLGISEGEKDKVLRRALDVAEDRMKEVSFRAGAIELIAMIDPLSHEEELKEYSHSTEPLPVQLAAIEGLGSIPGTHIGRFLLNRWEAITPALRDAAVNVLMQEKKRVELLLDAVANNEVSVSSIGWGRRVSLMLYSDNAVRKRARDLLRVNSKETEEMLEEYHKVLTIPGDADKGKQIYQRLCAACHQVREETGTAFGPDLATVRHWEPKALMNKILDPNRSVADGYEMTIVELKSGGSAAGVIHSQNSTLITLRNAGGAETIISRSDIESISSTNSSAMPSGLEQEISKQDMADLIAFIRQI